MAKWFDFLHTRLNPKTAEERIIMRQILECDQETRLRALCYQVCVNLVANAIGRCEMKVYNRKDEVRDELYYLWNYSPNVNENSTMFWHHFIGKLFEDNEALIIETTRRVSNGGTSIPAIVVADSFEPGPIYPARQNEYNNVVVGDYSYKRAFKENDVYHIKLNNQRIAEVRDAVVNGYNRMASMIQNTYTWRQGNHLKVKIGSVQQGGVDFEKKFKQILEDQVKPFFGLGTTILPEFAGYDYSFFEPTADSGRDYQKDLSGAVSQIWNFTAQAFGIPLVLVEDKVEAVGDATNRFLTNVIDPICDQLGEEVTRKEYDFDDWNRGSYVAMDSSTIQHFDLFSAAAGIEKLIGSGAFSVNDIRRACGQSRIEEKWADEHYMTLNIEPLDASRGTSLG